VSGKDHPHPGPEWVKSSLSFSNGNCVEVAWRSATACDGDGCVEVGQGPGIILVRDSGCFFLRDVSFPGIQVTRRG
jgi:hypothetical protein